MFSRRGVPDVWRKYLALLDETAAAGGRMFAQVHSRSLSALLSFKTQMPFDRLPVWKELRALPLAEQRRKLRDPELRRRLIEASGGALRRRAVGTEAKAADYDWLLVFDTVDGPHRTVAEVARERGQHPAETMIDLALEKDLDLFFLQPVANEDQDYALELMRHPRTVTTFSDSGAHVSQLMDSSLQTHLLSHWVREKQAFTLEQAVRMLTPGAGHVVGLRGPRPHPRGDGRRPRGLRSRHHRRRRCRRWWTICRRAPDASSSAPEVSPPRW